ncbi:leucine-rich repeat-containing protein 45 [Sinocyclocheilus rhinocerous]|uniref:leucine-rich repeat-containing protein 45 n=1 Tax=Sinocyclocheilus rhinocerous TaxID=307959 RepID=UPI0007B8EBF7|nr:PREDICTED: leucine-rich repeat-containing protein 45 [Sinocyclocheilus rhinocerous]
MEDFRRSYLRLCKEGGIDTQESVLAQLQDTRTVTGSCRLDLRGQSITVDTCSVLGRVLQNDAVFTEILLSDCMLSEEGVKLLLNGLCSNTTVKVLDLKGNNMRGTGAEALGQLLVRNKILRRLVLEWNALGMWEEGFAVFCEGLASNTSLSQLDLRNNQINHQGAAELCLALKRTSTLQELDLRWNNIGLLGGRSILEAMQQNRALIKLEMAGNNIPSDTLRAIEQSMNHNADRQSTLRESRSRTQVLSKEIQLLKDEKSRQFLSMMETIDRQKDEMGRSSRNSSIRLGQLQEVLSEQKSSVNSLTAKLQMTEAALALSEQKAHDLGELLTRVKMEKAELRDRQSREIKKEQEDLAGKEQVKVAEVSRVRVELQEQIGHLQAERTAQGGLKEKIAALEREMKVLSTAHREALLDKESEISSLLERLRIREGEIQRIREDEAQRASFLQNAILTYVQGSPLAHFSPKK